MKILFFGTPQFAAIILQHLIDANMPPIAIVTAPDKPAGRGHKLKNPPVTVLAAAHHISVLQPISVKEKLFLETLRGYKADIFVIAAYGKILPQALLDIPPKSVINVHPSLLPRHRGPSPIQGAILAGDEVTGVTLMLTDAQMDHGPIVMNHELRIMNHAITYMELHDQLAQIAGTLLVKTLPKWIAGEITPKEQDHSKATYTKLLTKEDGKVDWNKNAEYIEQQVRALNPWPGTFTFFKDAQEKQQMLKILKANVLMQTKPGLVKPGLVFLTQNEKLAVQTKENTLIVEELQLEGGKPMNSKEFLLGHKGLVGSVFVYS